MVHNDESDDTIRITNDETNTNGSGNDEKIMIMVLMMRKTIIIMDIGNDENRGPLARPRWHPHPVPRESCPRSRLRERNNLFYGLLSLEGHWSASVTRLSR